MTVQQTAGLPHSDIGGSKAACASPPLFAACHVFLRLPEPRHPPCALSFFCLFPRLYRRGCFLLALPHAMRHGERRALLCSFLRFARGLHISMQPSLSVPTFQRSPRLKRSGWRMTDRLHFMSPVLFPPVEWRMTDSNRRPPACKAGALAS